MVCTISFHIDVPATEYEASQLSPPIQLILQSGSFSIGKILPTFTDTLLLETSFPSIHPFPSKQTMAGPLTRSTSFIDKVASFIQQSRGHILYTTFRSGCIKPN